MKSLLISAGHSNSDSGAVFGNKFEATLATELRNIILSKLKTVDSIHVVSDGTGSTNEPLKEAIAKAKKVNLAVEIHFNASSNATATGVESISLRDKRGIAQALSQAIAKVTGDKIRGDAGWIDQTTSARGKLGFVEAGGIIIEVCFGSNATALFNYEAKKWLVAQAIVDVLVAKIAV